jgi:hypothetical protein
LVTATSNLTVRASVDLPLLRTNNPVNPTDLLTVQVYSGYRTDATISLVSMTGSIQYSRKMLLLEGQNTTKIPVRLLSTGVYILSVNDGKKQAVKKIFVGH